MKASSGNVHAAEEEWEAKVFSLGTQTILRSVFLLRLLMLKSNNTYGYSPAYNATAMCKRVNFILASISVFYEKILWIYLALFSLDFHYFITLAMLL